MNIGTETAELFWGPFSETRSQAATDIRSRPDNQIKESLINAFYQRVAKYNFGRFEALVHPGAKSVLHVGCGPEGLLLEQARQGADVTVLDPSREVIERLRPGLAAIPEAAGRIGFLQTDLAQFDLQRRFPLVMLSIFTFAVPERQHQQAVLRRAVEHLEPNGMIAFDCLMYKPATFQDGVVMDVEYFIDDKSIAAKIGWKPSPDSHRLMVNSCSIVQQDDGAAHQYVEAIRIDLMNLREVEDFLSDGGLVIAERSRFADDQVEHHVFQCRRRADISYPLWHPNLPMNGLEQMVTVLVEGKGCKVKDNHGKEYIDASGGLWNTHCGLGEPEIIKAITEQLQRLSYGTLFAWRGNEPALELARQLIAIAPKSLTWAYLTGSGSESVELAIKIARLYSSLRGNKGREIVYLDESYHGTFFGSMSLTGIVPFGDFVGPLLPGVSKIATPNSLRCPVDAPYVDFALSCAELLEEKAARGEVAAFIVEPIPASAGVVIPPPEYFRRIDQICREHGVLLILDEVATGFGRTGRWFAAEHYGLQPDILLMSKGMNSGYLPLGAVLFSAEIGESLLKANSGLCHGSTYNGHPACCAAALATIDLMRRRGLVERSAESGIYFRERLNDDVKTIASVREIRAIGLMLAVVLIQEDGTAANPNQILQIFGLLQQAGILSYMGPSTISFCPALVITDEEIDIVVERLRTVLVSVRLREGNLEHLGANSTDLRSNADVFHTKP